MIELEHVSRSFGSFLAVNDISFSIKTGEIVGLLGPNGAGKTTTMRMITGFLNPTAGSITIDGMMIDGAERSVKAKIGYMPESAPLYSDMIVKDYLVYVAQMQGVNADERVPVLCDDCGLHEVMHKNIAELSRGYRQRVGLAHALMNNPEILILDEPTGGLDPNQITEVRSLIKEIGKTRTVIISTHILGEVEMLCDRVIIISRGKIAADSPTALLRQQYGSGTAVSVEIGGASFVDVASVLKTVPNVQSVSEVVLDEVMAKKMVSVLVSAQANVELRPAIARVVSEKGWDLYGLSIKQNSLEDVFRSITTDVSLGEHTGANNVSQTTTQKQEVHK